MSFDPDTAAIRFGTGLGPNARPVASTTAMLAGLTGPDLMAERFPIQPFSDLFGLIIRNRTLRKAERAGDTTARGALRELRRDHRAVQTGYLQATVARQLDAPLGFRERLVRFWADHFTAKIKIGFMRHSVATYVEEAIRPHIAGDFTTLLTAVVTHPVMLAYLDQNVSVGASSGAARRRPGRGVNENLAREVLELHTLGVQGAYSQRDVAELADLFTGLTFTPEKGFLYRPFWAEPGPEVVLGKRYGRQKGALKDIRAFLGDVARHPDTARHLASKLTRHFVNERPEAGAAGAMVEAYLDQGGALTALYQALLDHPSSWQLPASKVKQPFDFISSSLRALGVQGREMTALKPGPTLTYLAAPMRVMGQAWDDPPGPDGWPEKAGHWITPQGLAGRLQWAMTVPRVVRPDLPDPRVFVETSLGGRAGADLRFAAQGAATKWEGLGLILASPEFQRR